MITNSPKRPDGCVEPGGPAITILQLEVSTSQMLPSTKPKAEGVFSETHEGRVLQQKQIFSFVFLLKIVYASMYVCVQHVHSALEGQKRVSHPWDENCKPPMGAENQNWALWKSCQCS